MKRLLTFGCLFFAALLIKPAVQAQVPKPFSKTHLLSYPQDGWGLLTAPAGWNGRSWLTASVATTGILLSFKLDQPVFRQVLRNPDNPFHTGLLAGSRHWGDGLYTFPALGLLYLHGTLRDRPQDQLAAMHATRAFVLTRLLVQLPKYLFQRAEPGWLAGNQGRFDGPGGGGIHHSFPSGHVISAFAAAAAIDASYSNPWVSTLAYTAATTVAVQRVGSGSHWFSDVCAGAALGYFAGRWIVKKGKTNVTLFPSFQAGAGMSLSAGWRF